ncbi:hypothetical protein GO988_21615 [Hymenobacter sp. HMF4947]|uniref:Uncharacterized protein n=1 Tax=Hymenobacter ginkgonis TaxID=2682976 RepID=A0A7K1TKR4_9BACT|nr:hypothetical protein [Hymenobacter ginkgonis]MVN78936.1 hypothetical protein [Hymenobacter ginkgonis]
MRYDLLKRLDATDPLAQLFNSYLQGLSTLAIMAEPSYNTMAEVSTLYSGSGPAKHRNHLRHSARRYYELTVLRNSLHDIHRHVVEAIALLEGFFAAYDGDLLRYAIERRFKSIDEYGSDDESDWYRNPEVADATATDAWQVVYKDDEESLAYYTLHADLAYHFGSDNRGEHIGTSGPEAFYPYTALVQQQSAFSFRKMLEGVTGKEVTITRLAEDGSQIPLSLADHIEDEMNEDIRSNHLVLRFDTVLAMCAELGRRFPTYPADQVSTYQLLLTCLQDVREVRIAGQPPF